MTQSSHLSLIHMKSAKIQHITASHLTSQHQYERASHHMMLCWYQLICAAAAASGDLT